MTTGNNLPPAAILAEINSNMPDNTVGAITPSIVRQILADISFSYASLNSTNTLSGKNQFGLQSFVTAGVYTGGTSNSNIFGVRGSPSSPVTDNGATAVFSNVSNTSDLNGATTVYANGTKYNSSLNVGARAFWGEVFDNAASTGSYSEGARFFATANAGTNASVSGLITGAVSSVSFEACIGHETQVFNLFNAATTTFNSLAFSAGSLSTCGQGAGVACDAAFLVNPFSNAAFVSGFFIPSGGNTVSDTGLRIDATLNYGIDFSRGTFNTDAIKTPGFTVSPAGLLTSGSNGGSSGQITLKGSTSGSSAISVNSTGDTFNFGTSFTLSTTTFFGASSTAGRPIIEIQNTTSDGNSSGYFMTKSRNNGNTVTNDVLGIIGVFGFANSGYQETALIEVIQSGSSSGSNIPSQINLTTSSAAAQFANTWEFFSDGTIIFPAGSFTANGTGTVTITNVLPNGHTATINKWLTIRDNSGTLSYIPIWQ